MSIVPKSASSKIFSDDDGINLNRLTYEQQKEACMNYRKLKSFWTLAGYTRSDDGGHRLSIIPWTVRI
jgi:hypothetical protein